VIRAPWFVLALALALLAGCKRQPPLAQRVRDRIQSNLPAATVVIVDESTLKVTVGTESATVSLDNLSVACSNEPGRCDELTDRFAQNLSSVVRPRKPIVAEDLRVMLYAKQTVDAYQKAIVPKSPVGSAAQELVASPFQADMMLVLVRDMPDGVELVNRGALGEVKLDAEAARAVAGANLERALRSLPTESAAPGVFRVRAGDSYDAARILLPKLWSALSKEVSGDLLVVAPTRDVVFATGSKDPAALVAMSALAKKAFDAGPYPLSTSVLRLTDTGFVSDSAPPR